MNNTVTNQFPTSKSWPERDYEAINRVARSDGIGVVDLWELSPRRLETNEPRTAEIIETLFPGDPLLCCGWSRHRFDTRSRSRWYKLNDLELIVPNPMIAEHGVTADGRQSAHTLSNTGPRRFLVVEFDFEMMRSPEETELLMQLRASDCDVFDLSACLLLHLAEKAPLALVVHSGGKSLHGWFCCNDQDEERLRRFMRYAVSLGADPATWTRSQFTRMPDGKRENGNRQPALFFNPTVVQ
jgi:hypothetical protein